MPVIDFAIFKFSSERSLEAAISFSSCVILACEELSDESAGAPMRFLSSIILTISSSYCLILVSAFLRSLCSSSIILSFATEFISMSWRAVS